MHVNRSFVLTWAATYEQHMGSTEPWLLDEVGPAAVARGHYEPDEFVAIARWKTPRSRQHIAANSDSDVRQITAMAFSGVEPLQHRVLTLLGGVRVPTATALLAVAFPDRHTILDVRSTASLGRLGEWDGQGGYLAYLEVCRGLADRLKVSLRALDRALWRWSKDGYPAS
jgi:hypothetical protein